MAYAAISYITPQYEDFPNQWLKAYEPATTTPKLMAIDGTGTTTAAKFELNAEGFPRTSGDVLIIPFINGAYDLWLFATEADADANNTVNAFQLADNITAPPVAGSSSVNELTVATMMANTNKVYEVGDLIDVEEYWAGNGGGGRWKAVLTSSVTPNTFNVIVGVADPLISFVLIDDSEIHLDRYGLIDGMVDAHLLIQSAIDQATDGSVILLPDKDMEVGIDIPSGQSDRPAGIIVNKPLTLQGTTRCKIKVKGFCSAWASYTQVMSAVMVNNSDVIIDGLYIDGNNDNHYELDGAVKWWETGPLLKRPPSAITVHITSTDSNIDNVVIKNCLTDNSLSAYSVVGGGIATPTDESDFYDRTKILGCISDVTIRNNKSIRCRGNDILYSGGCYDVRAYDNVSINSMYHAGRMYQGAIDCHMYNNKAYNDYDYLATLYTPTLNGYWRTDDASDPAYPIVRTGWKMGSLFVNLNDNGGNVRGCTMHDNIIAYKPDTNPAILATTTDTASLFMENLTWDCSFYDNRVYNSPNFCLIVVHLTGGTPKNISVSNNEFFESKQIGTIQSDGVYITDNKFFDFIKTSTYGLRIHGSNCVALRNEFYLNDTSQGTVNSINWTLGNGLFADGNIGRNVRSKVTGDTSLTGAHDGSANASVLTDSGESWVVNSLTGRIIRNTTDGSEAEIISNTATTITATLAGGTDNDWDVSDAYTVLAISLGSNALGEEQLLLNSWVTSSGTNYDSSPIIHADAQSNINLSGTINGDSSTNDKIIDFFSVKLRPRTNIAFTAVVVVAGGATAIGEVFVGRVNTSGDVFIDRNGKTAIGDLSFNVSYPGLNFTVES